MNVSPRNQKAASSALEHRRLAKDAIWPKWAYGRMSHGKFIIAGSDIDGKRVVGQMAQRSANETGVITYLVDVTNAQNPIQEMVTPMDIVEEVTVKKRRCIRRKPR